MSFVYIAPRLWVVFTAMGHLCCSFLPLSLMDQSTCCSSWQMFHIKNCSHTHWSTGHIRIVAMASISCSKPWGSIHKYTQVQSTFRIHHKIFLKQLRIQCWGLHLLWSLQGVRIRFITTYTLCIHGQICTLCIHWQSSIFIVDCWW